MSENVESKNPSYKELMDISRELFIMRSAVAILAWDTEVNMPKNSIGLRGQQLSLLSGINHKKSIDPKIGDLLDKINKDEVQNLTEEEKRNVYLSKKGYDQLTKLPEELVRKIVIQRTKTNHLWKEAKEKKNFNLVKPELQKLYDLVIERAKKVAAVKGISEENLYDALLDDFEPGLTAETVTKVFDELKAGLIPIVKKCVNSPKQPDMSKIERSTPIESQKKLAKELADFIGYDLDHGRIDEAEHPFTTGYYTDVRITTHYYVNKVSSSIYSVLHEGGHGLYEMNLNPNYMYQPIGSASSLGIHESQSRFVENIIGRSTEFWEYFLPKFKALTNGIYDDVKLEDVVHAMNQVAKTKIRVEADEVTYSLHVIIRFEIERDLVAGKITIDDLPEAWNKKYKEYLDIDVVNDSEGVMQDTHWYGGMFGYFPTYALGNVYNAQMLNTMEKTIPNWKDLIRKGNFKPIKEWLINNVHKYGDLYDPADLIKKITNEELNVKYFIDYLNKKYSKLYDYEI